MVAEHYQISNHNGVARLAGVDRAEHADAGKADHDQAGGREARQQQPGIDAAEELHEAEDRQTGQHDQHEVREPGHQLAEDDLAVAQVGGQQVFESLAVFFFSDGAGDVRRREDEREHELHDHEHEEQLFGEAGHHLQGDAFAVAVAVAGGQLPVEVDPGQQRQQDADVGHAEEEVTTAAANADEVIEENGAEKLEPAAAQLHGRRG